MSYCVDDTYDVYDEREVTARREHRCAACRETIAKGHRYWRVAIVFDGSARTVKRCRRCQAIHTHLRSISDGDTWPEERLNCGESYEDEWGGSPPDEIAALAFALPGDMQ